ncbi:MAG TPA: fibronectin type III-like domain-contianing protein [Chthoniobacterales bacterium]|nr:fibronectin type III-like domain-contianing protein [Chthoniobacterales bacterium]
MCGGSVGVSGKITITLDAQSFAYYDTVSAGWVDEPGVYDIWIGASSRDLRLSGEVTLRSGQYWPVNNFGEIPQQEVNTSN